MLGRFPAPWLKGIPSNLATAMRRRALSSSLRIICVPTIWKKFVLQEEGFDVAEAGSGEEALEELAAGQTSLVLLDIGLPGMDGFATCQRIREFSRVPIIMVTAEDKDDDKVRGLELGADDYVIKPFSTNELAARVKAVVRRFEWDYSTGGRSRGASSSYPGWDHTRDATRR